jgi:fibro-slime domain-containing protein
VIVEVSLNETKEVLAGFAEVLEETIAAKPLAALEITPRHFAAAKNADVSSALFSKQSAGLGDALKSAFSSVSAAEVYGAETDAYGNVIEHFPVNLYDYMGTLRSTTSSTTGTMQSGNNRYDTQNDNFNTPALLTTNSHTANTDYYYGSYSIKSYFLFNQPQVISNNKNNWYTYNDNTGNNKHGHQNRVGATNHLSDVVQGIAKSKLGNDGAFEINFATMNGLRLFPLIPGQSSNKVYIYGDNNTVNGQQYSSQQNTNPGMIQAYPNRELPFVKDSNGYYSFDSARERVYLDGSNKANKRLTRVTDSSGNGFFPFNTNGTKNNSSSESYNFGMSMNIEFVMPKDGLVNGNDMIFEFNGDDDLWVYIDGQLVLDLGGIHGKQSGTINFRTKMVKTMDSTTHTIRTLNSGSPYYPGTTKDVIMGTNTENFSQISGATQEFLAGFGDYTKHTLQLFYMERNPTDSNCMIKFNLATVEPGKLNVFKYADENTDQYEKFEFDVFVSENDSSNKPTADGIKLTSDNAEDTGVDITESDKYVSNLGALALTKDDRFALDIPEKYKWVRVVERAKLANGEERFSTVFLGDGINESGKDSGWMSINKTDKDKTNALFCFNYAQHPITLTKFRLDGATWDTEEDVVKYYEMETVKFDLHEVVNGTKSENPVDKGANLTTDDKGQITLNKPGDNTTPKLKPNTKYVLVEQETDATKNYERTPIYFETTQGVSALVKKIWYYDAAGNEVSYSGKPGETGYGQIVFADATGRHIELYNKRLTGSVRVEKTLNDIQNVNFDAQGDPIFLFKLEKLEDLGEGVYGDDVLGTQSTSVRFGSRYTLNTDGTSATMPSPFNNLEAGYYYRISELNTMRYDQVGNATLNIANTGSNNVAVPDIDTDNATVTFLMTPALAEATSAAQNPAVITASFTNTRTYPDYLSDTDVAVNTLSYKPPWPAPSAPVVYEVQIYKNNQLKTTKLVTKDDLIDISTGGNGIGEHMGTPDTDGAIGRSGNSTSDAKFYPYTPINADIADANNVVRLYLN